jgi:hypothetical protein
LVVKKWQLLLRLVPGLVASWILVNVASPPVLSGQTELIMAIVSPLNLLLLPVLAQQVQALVWEIP